MKAAMALLHSGKLGRVYRASLATETHTRELVDAIAPICESG